MHVCVHTWIAYVIAVIVGTLQYHHEMCDACINRHIYEAYDAQYIYIFIYAGESLMYSADTYTLCDDPPDNIFMHIAVYIVAALAHHLLMMTEQVPMTAAKPQHEDAVGLSLVMCGAFE